MSFERPDYSPTAKTQKPDVDEQLVSLLVAWGNADRRSGGRGIPPEPLPTDYREAASVWRSRFQRERHPSEVVQQTTAGEVDPYVARLKTTLARFLRLGRADRQFVIGAIEDGVAYLGDSPEMLRDIYEEHDRMQRMGVDAYRDEAIALAKRKLGIVIGG